jgi:hypothetical protein
MTHDDRTELHFYDFDGTLFRSPEPPEWWGKKSWWINHSSLGRPCVPDVPGPDWWVEPVVASARKSIQDPNIWAALMTGRTARHGGFSYRVPELVHDKGLNFDEIHLSNTSDTEGFKRDKIVGLLRRFPHVAAVQFWDDRSDFLSGYVDLVESTGREVIPHLVVAEPHAPVCTEDDFREASVNAARVISVNGHRYERVGG